MSLNIKNPTTHRLVRELAAATGQSQTAAVEDAVRRRLQELRSAGGGSPGQQQRRGQASQIAAAFRADLSDEDLRHIRSADAWLYDDQGLPR
ncbi:type II toxin-antitoxin system VapB family antitoxin [Ornithinimicrobium cavernae]|uniref:type II toxin-antitoxin system VapB family antitoxin n=1 Tax=Ornithinimicrobium cavernae TaxID=2666047 RepID=UPI000D69A66D|nr:type II toxin-antitoxin system VapB family antitoxin [Ornithinimicrobium cavernae]